MRDHFLVIGCNGFVSAIDISTGEELWRTKLRDGIFQGSSGSDVSVLVDGEKVFAGCSGRIYGLKLSDGSILWSNDLKGLGFNEVALARQGVNTQFIARVEYNQSHGNL